MCSLPSEGLSIPQDPDVPCCCEHHLKEERMAKTGFGIEDTMLGIRSLSLINLKIIPHPAAEVALEEQVGSVFMDICITYNTKIIII